MMGRKKRPKEALASKELWMEIRQKLDVTMGAFWSMMDVFRDIFGRTKLRYYYGPTLLILQARLMLLRTRLTSHYCWNTDVSIHACAGCIV